MSASTDAKGNVAFADHVVLTDHMRDGALEGLRRADRQDRPAGRRQAPTRSEGRFTDRDPTPPTRPARSATSRASARRSGRSRPSAWSTTSSSTASCSTTRRIEFVRRAGALHALSHRSPIRRCAMPAGILTPDVGISTTIGYFAAPAGLHRAVAVSNDATIAPIDHHPGRRGAGGGISRPLEQWRHVAAGQRSPTIPMAASRGNAGPDLRAVCSARAAFRSTTSGAPASTPSSPPTTPICALRHLPPRPAGQRPLRRRRRAAARASPSPAISSRACAPPTTTAPFPVPLPLLEFTYIPAGPHRWAASSASTSTASR